MSTAVPPVTPPAPRPRSRWRRLWPVVPLVAITFALMLADLEEMGYTPFTDNSCALEEDAQSGISARIYGPLAQRALGTAPASNPVVTLVTIDANTEPPGLLNNTCDSRAFLARLVGDLNSFGAREIVIDKFYSPDSCGDAAKTAEFIQALRSSRAHVVVGQPTHALSDTSAGCLALSPRLEFNPSSNPATPEQPAAQPPATPRNCTICYGLTRLNSDTLKIPLRWPVFVEPPPSQTPAIQPAISLPGPPGPRPTPVSDPSQGDSLSLVAAETYNPAIASAPKLAHLLAKGYHPYTTFLNLPTLNAMTGLCNAEPAHTYGNAAPGQQDLCTPWVYHTDPAAQMAQLKNLIGGKIVVIGDLSESDMQPFPGGDRPGVFLQANYIQSILDQRFLVQVPLWLTLTILVLFVMVVYAVHWAHDSSGEAIFSPEKAGLVTFLIFAALALITLLALLRFQEFTPLWAVWGAGVFVVFKYLESSGHHRSQHLLRELAGELEHAREEIHGPGHKDTESR